MAIGALAEAGVLFDRPDLVAAATEAAELLVSSALAAQDRAVVGTARIVRTSRDGVGRAERRAARGLRLRGGRAC